MRPLKKKQTQSRKNSPDKRKGEKSAAQSISLWKVPGRVCELKPSSPPVFNAPTIFIHRINRKPKPKVFLTTSQNPMLGFQVQVRVSPAIHQIPPKPNLVLCLPSCMSQSWTSAKGNRGNFTSAIIQQGQTRFRFETKAKTGHLEAVRKLFQILNRPGGVCTSP